MNIQTKAKVDTGISPILNHLARAERLTITELATMNSNGATNLQKQKMALALTNIGTALDELLEIRDGE